MTVLLLVAHARVLDPLRSSSLLHLATVLLRLHLMTRLPNQLIKRVLNPIDVRKLGFVEGRRIGVVRVRSEAVRSFGDAGVAGTLEEGLERVGCAFDRGDFAVFDDAKVDDAAVGGGHLRRGLDQYEHEGRREEGGGEGGAREGRRRSVELQASTAS